MTSGVEAISNMAESLLCCICLDEDKNTVLLPCRHLCACASCSLSLRTCPLCRATVRHRVPVFTGITHVDGDALSPDHSTSRCSTPAVVSKAGGLPTPRTPSPDGIVCPLHGADCPAGPFDTRSDLDAHMAEGLESVGAEVAADDLTHGAAEEGASPTTAVRHAAWAAAQSMSPPSEIVVVPSGNTSRRGVFGPWTTHHQEYHFKILVGGVRFNVATRYSAVRKMAQRLGPIAPASPPFPSKSIFSWLGGSATPEMVEQRHAELAAWLQALFAPRAVISRGGPTSGLYDAGGAVASNVVHQELGLSRHCVEALTRVAEQRRAWYCAAYAVLAEYGITAGCLLRRSVQAGAGRRNDA